MNANDLKEFPLRLNNFWIDLDFCEEDFLGSSPEAQRLGFLAHPPVTGAFREEGPTTLNTAPVELAATTKRIVHSCQASKVRVRQLAVGLTSYVLPLK
ncbi:hypothetical protein NPIL_151461 [Nephila pilipes]|uniref:Uncharacterized protein n=1 Tax=Nephila pilipes TaxID=299642 RepID=A0A8X6QJE2_NEPPI|nr:hypothetical protein NPIL_151461 [Nephila pilipes]